MLDQPCNTRVILEFLPLLEFVRPNSKVNVDGSEIYCSNLTGHPIVLRLFETP